MKTYKALSNNALLQPFRRIMTDAKEISVIVSWWKYFAYMLLNQVRHTSLA